MATYVGPEDSKAQKVKKVYIGIDGIAKEVTKVYVGGDDGIAHITHTKSNALEEGETE